MPATMPDQKRYIVLDGNALLHRAWHAIPPLTTKSGLVVNAAYGFTNVVEKMRATFKPDYMVVAWDLAGPTFRHDDYKEYKATREKKADELYAQIPIIQNILTAYGIPSLSAKGYEADDIIGTVATKNEKHGNIDTIIVTGDLDTLQLVSPDTKVVFFVRGLSEVKIYDEAAIKERYNLSPKQLIELKTLVGDTSDNLPGVPGIGEKGAAELLANYGSVEEIFKALKKGSLPEKFVKKFTGQEAHAAQMRKLVTIVRDVPLKEFDMKLAATREPHVKDLVSLFRELEFKALLKKYEAKPEEEGGKSKEESLSRTKVREKKKTKTAFAEKLDDILPRRCSLVVVSKSRDLFGGNITAIAVSDGTNTFLLEHPDKKTAQPVIEFLTKSRSVVAHDAKAAMHALATLNAECADDLCKIKFEDTMIASYLISPGNREYDLGAVVSDVLGAHQTLPESPAEQAPLILSLADKLNERLEKDKMTELYEKIELPLIPVLFSMEHKGILVDKKKLSTLSESFAKSLDILTKKIYKAAGKEFNINSPSQLAEVLFTKLGLPTKGIKKTKNSFSTAAPELEKLAEAHPVIEFIEEYREIAKLKSTYADPLPSLVASDGRIHTTFNQTIAATGRLSSINPNLQNLPIRSDLGREIRNAFVAEKGFELVSADYSQIELRLAAHIAQDKVFIQAFKDGADIHRRTAADVWGVPEDKVTKDQRAAAKAINFSILYGVGARSLARATKMPFEEARQFIERYFEVHEPLRAYMDAMKLKARTDGYVETLFGRRRYLPDINSGVPQLVAAAERMAINMPVQGTQADILKKAMILIDDWIKKEKIDGAMLLQVHDELVFEVKEKDVAKVKREVPKIMSSVIDLSVPLVVDIVSAKRWGEMK